MSFVLNGRPDQTIPNRRDRQSTPQRRDSDRCRPLPRSLKRGRSNIVLCVLPDAPVSDAFEEFKRSLSRALGASDFTCVFLHAADSSTTPLASLWQHFHPSVVAAFGTLSDAAAIRRSGIALLDGVFEPSNSSPTGLDQQDIRRLQVQHLIGKGHRRIGYAAVADPREHAFCLLRIRGAEQLCREDGLPDPVVEYVDYTERGAHTALERWRTDTVTAVAAFKDLAALSLLTSARRSRISVPADLAVIGVDDQPPSSHAAPALSTVSMNLGVPARTLAAHILTVAGALTALTDDHSPPLPSAWSNENRQNRKENDAPESAARGPLRSGGARADARTHHF